MGRAQRLGCDHEFAPRESEGCSARDPHEGGSAEHAYNAGEINQGLPEIGDHSQRQYQRRKRQ